jgi:hypothetical protein
MSFTVHFAVLNNSSWVKDFFNGVPLKSAAVEEVIVPSAAVATNTQAPLAIKVAPSTTYTVEDQATLAVKAKPTYKDLAPHLATPG